MNKDDESELLRRSPMIKLSLKRDPRLRGGDVDVFEPICPHWRLDDEVMYER